MSPLISFVIPAYTYAEYTIEAVQSLLRENEDFELIVVEDFDLLPSEPKIREVVERARNLWPRTKG